MRERFSIFRSRAKLGCLRDLGIRRVIAKLIDEHLSHEIGQLVSVKGVVSLHIVPSGRCVHKGRESVEDLKPASLHNLSSHLIRHKKVMAHRIVAPASVAATQLCGWIGTDA